MGDVPIFLFIPFLFLLFSSSSSQMRCVRPQYLSRLPPRLQGEVNEIWIDPTPPSKLSYGDEPLVHTPDCQWRMERTRMLLSKMTRSEYSHVFGRQITSRRQSRPVNGIRPTPATRVVPVYRPTQKKIPTQMYVYNHPYHHPQHVQSVPSFHHSHSFPSSSRSPTPSRRGGDRVRQGQSRILHRMEKKKGRMQLRRKTTQRVTISNRNNSSTRKQSVTLGRRVHNNSHSLHSQQVQTRRPIHRSFPHPFSRVNSSEPHYTQSNPPPPSLYFTGYSHPSPSIPSSDPYAPPPFDIPSNPYLQDALTPSSPPSASPPPPPSSSRPCHPPPSLSRMPEDVQKSIRAVWSGHEGETKCDEIQRKTKQILLNAPHRLRQFVHTPEAPSLQCKLPHFFGRLEPSLQGKLERIWIGYKEGMDCENRVKEQIGVLTEHDISIESFNLPPIPDYDTITDLFKTRDSQRI